MKKYKVRPFGHLEKREEKSQRKWGLSAVLKKCVSDNKQKRRERERERERERKLWEIYSGKKSSKKKEKKKCFLCSSCISKCCNLYLILSNYSELIPWFFPSRRKCFARKFLYSCVIVLLLCLLKFINSYIEFFPIHFASNTLYSGQN